MPNGGKFVQTVRGILPVEQLGFCQCHEHLFIAKGQSFTVNPALWLDNLEKTKREVLSFRDAGGAALVDAQPVGCGRMADYLLATAKETGVEIIASTGFHKLQFYPENHWIFNADEDSLTSLFLAELRTGMYLDGDRHLPVKQLPARAGIIKIALDNVGISGPYIKLFKAAACAALHTGTPILCHVETENHVFNAIDFFSKQGIEAQSIILCHLDRVKCDPAFHREVAKSGVYLEYDTIGRFKYHSDEEEIKLLRQMLAYGLEDQILLGLDTTRKRMKSYGGSIGLDYILTAFIPRLIKSGVPGKTIDKLTIANPRQALALKVKGGPAPAGTMP